ncbi:MAG: hypothetical protein RLN70_08785, partial [Rhodospirillaceae bacterium]
MSDYSSAAEIIHFYAHRDSTAPGGAGIDVRQRVMGLGGRRAASGFTGQRGRFPLEQIDQLIHHCS